MIIIWLIELIRLIWLISQNWINIGWLCKTFFLDDLGPAFLWARAAIPKLYSCRTANIALRFAATLFLWFKAADVPVDLCHRVEFDVANDRYRRLIASHSAPLFFLGHAFSYTPWPSWPSRDHRRPPMKRSREPERRSKISSPRSPSWVA